ncbi:MAG: SdrD B-like domain-containing protein, partial [Cyanobacteria bacterium J06636_16]
MSGTTIFTESFETDGNGSRYTTSVPEFSDGSSDFFTRTDGTNIFSDYEVSDPDGSFYFAAMDTDAEPPNQDIISVTWEDIDIASFTNLTFTGLFAEDDEGINQDWDRDSLVFIEYQIDNNGFQKLIQFAAENRLNTEPGLDTNFDGVRDGAVLSDTFTEFSAAITGTGSILDLKLTIANLEAGDEDIAFDLFTIKGDAVSAGNNGSIGDVIWNDLDGDGIFDSDETGINGLTVNLISDTNGNGIIDNGESVLKTATTSGNGDFNFTVLPAGNYIVDVTDTEGILANFSLTQGSAPLAVNLSSDEDFNDADFGYQNTNALLVTNTNDSGAGSLRRAILNANAIAGANTITFDAALAGQTITLSSGELTVTDDLTVQGLGADQLTLSGDNSSRIFNISDDTNNEIEVVLDGLSLIDGNTDDDGGAIWNREELTLSNSILNSNAAADDGGAIRNDGTLLITDSTLANNTSTGSTSTSGGGAILNTT